MTRPRAEGRGVLIALVAGLTLGSAVAASGNARWIAWAGWLQPIGTLWVNAIRMTVIPLVASLLITGVAGLSDLRAVGRLGGRTLLVFGAILVVCAAAPVLLMPPLMAALPWPTGTIALPPGSAEAAAAVQASGTPVGVVQWFTTLVPPNPVEAAASGNMVSFIVFVFLLALATARSGAETREPLVGFFKALGDVLLLLVRWIIALAPPAVFALVLPLAATSGGSLVGAVGLYIAAFAIGCAVVTALYYPIVALAGGIGVRRFAQHVLPAQLIGVSCSSSIASLPAMVSSATTMGIPPRVSGFVLPLAVSLFKPAATVAWVVGALFVGRIYGVPVEARGLAIIAAAGVLLSFAAPGVPRGAFLLLTPLFTAIGLPAEGIGVLIAVDLIPDMCATVVNVTGDVAAAAVVARGESGDVVPGAGAPEAEPLLAGQGHVERGGRLA